MSNFDLSKPSVSVVLFNTSKPSSRINRSTAVSVVDGISNFINQRFPLVDVIIEESSDQYHDVRACICIDKNVYKVFHAGSLLMPNIIYDIENLLNQGDS